jgi:YaiO family outer membrane protein
MRAPNYARPLLLSVLLGATGLTPAHAQGRPFLEWAGELSLVRSGGRDTTWQISHVAGGVQEDGRYGWTLAGEHHRRGDLGDWVGQANAFRRAGVWIVSGGVGLAADPEFTYRQSLEGELARIVGRGFVVHGGYRYLRYRDATVHMIQPAVSWYLRGHELQARGFVVRNATTDKQSGTVLLRANLEASPRIRLAAGTALGTRIFDATAIRNTDAEAWVVFGVARIAVTPHFTVVAGAGGAHEEPMFDQRTLSLGARWTF